MIKFFKNEYNWLSNFAPVEVELDGIKYPSVEHAYNSAKSDDADWKAFCSDAANKPGNIKRESRKIRMKEDWEQIRLEIMEKCLKQKFSTEPYRTKLLETGNQLIQEGNLWNDTFWGVSLKTNGGENHLGKLIMKVRTLLKTMG